MAGAKGKTLFFTFENQPGKIVDYGHYDSLHPYSLTGKGVRLVHQTQMAHATFIEFVSHSIKPAPQEPR